MSGKSLIPLLVIGGIAAYLLFGSKKATSPYSAPAGTNEVDDGALPGIFQKAGGLVQDVIGIFSKPTELQGMDGVPPTLSGHMDMLGAYGNLGGTYFGG